jgi:ribosomal protein S18 acetylase RimI-like enzyme
MSTPVTPSTLVRRAAQADVSAILPLVRAICDLHAQRDPQRFEVLPDVLDRYAAWLPLRIEDPTSVLLVAEARGVDGTMHLVGYLVGTVEAEVPIFWIPRCGWVHDIYVLPAYRSQGLAKQMMDLAIEHFQQQGLQQMRLHTGSFNDSARAFFSEFGFRPSVVEMLRPLGPNTSPS